MTKNQAKKRLLECQNKINNVMACGYMTTKHYIALLAALENAHNSRKLN